MSKDIKKALEHCINNECVDCPNKEELGSGEIVCRGRLLPEVLEYVADLEAKLAESEKQRQHLKDWLDNEVLTSVDNESYYATINEYEEEVKQLKQQLHELPKNIVEDIKKVSDTAILGSGEIYDYTITAKNLDTILRKYGDE